MIRSHSATRRLRGCAVLLASILPWGQVFSQAEAPDTFDLSRSLDIARRGVAEDDRLEALDEIRRRVSSFSADELEAASQVLLILFLNDPDADIRDSSALTLSSVILDTDFPADDAIAEPLVAALSTLTESQQLSWACYILGFVGSYSALDAVVTVAVSSTDARVRDTAHRAFKEIKARHYEDAIPPDIAMRLIAKSTEDLSEPVREVLDDLLWTVLYGRDSTDLWQRYDSLEDHALRVAFVRVIGRTGETSGERLLAILASDPSAELRAAAATTTTLGGYRSLTPLSHRALGRAAVEDPDPTARLAAIQALGFHRGDSLDSRVRTRIFKDLQRVLRYASSASERGAASDALVVCMTWWCDEDRDDGARDAAIAHMQALSTETDAALHARLSKNLLEITHLDGSPRESLARILRGQERALMRLATHSNRDVADAANRLLTHLREDEQASAQL